ncbi:MAG: crotonobetainyl-CoA:carnitine CoA-transferase CaiB-like acyl-CoA transferase, partial [Alteromonas macleodii]
LGLEELKEESRFIDNQIRVENRRELKNFMDEKAKEFSSDYLMNEFLKIGVPAGIIKNMEEVFEQPKAQASILEDKMSNGNTAKRVSQVAFKLEK